MSQKTFAPFKKNPIAQQLRMQSIFKKRSELNNVKSKIEKNKSNESSANQLSVERHLSTINGDKSTTTTNNQHVEETRKRLRNDENESDSKRVKSNENENDDKRYDQEIHLKHYLNKLKFKYNMNDDDISKKVETNIDTLMKREKSIQYGKNTDEYKRYNELIEKKERESFHPRTPNKFSKCSRRKFDGLIKSWRVKLHTWDQKPASFDDKFNESEDFMDYDDNENILVIQEENEFIF